MRSLSRNQGRSRSRNYYEAEEVYLAVEPRSDQVGEGDHACFTSRVRSTAPYRVTWVKNGEAIEASDKHEMRDHEDAHTMQVNRCAASDMGSYKLVVESQQGETAVSNFTLTVVPRQYQAVQQMRQKYMAPPPAMPRSQQRLRVTSELHYELKLDGSVRLECAVSNSQLVSSAQWYKDQYPVATGEYSEKYKTSRHGPMHTLVIDDVSEEDAGTFRCVFVGIDGSEMDTHLRLTPETCHRMRRKWESPRRRRGSGQQPSFERADPKPLPGSAPKISRIPSKIQVGRGKVISVPASIKSQHQPYQAVWMRNGAQLRDGDESGRIRIVASHSQTTLTILGARSSDCGVYELHIHNNSGSDRRHLGVNVI